MTRRAPPRIRPATPADAVSISELISTVTVSDIASQLTPAGRRRLLDSMTPEAIRKYFVAGYRYHLAVDDAESVIGVVATRGNRHLYHLFVASAWQGRGLGRQLWQVARDACIAAGNRGEFTVNSSLNAVPVYERFGFVRESEPVESDGVIAVPMRLSIAQCIADA